MDLQTTQLVFTAIMTLASLVWAHSLVRALQMKPAKNVEDNPWAALPDEELPTTQDAEMGRRTVRGQLDNVSRAIAKAILGQNVPGVFTPMFQLTEREPNRVVAQKDAPRTCNQPPGMQFKEVEFDLRPIGESTVEVDYRINFGSMRTRSRNIALGIIFGLGLPLLLIGGLLMWVFVANNPNPTIRWQVFQTLQISHVLWPPFLFIHQYKSGRRHSRTFVSNLLMMAELADGVDAVSNTRI